MSRIDREKKTVAKMIGIYCKLNHGASDLCEECPGMLVYAYEKLDKCPYGLEKPACNNCPVHCYKPEQREKMKEIMRFSGPKMLLRHPYLAIMHLIDNKRKTPELKKNSIG
jgi:hypothetical protein